MTLLASLFANSIVPSSPAMMPSALLPSHDHTTFQVCPAAITPGISVEAGGGGGSGGGAGLALAGCPPPIEKGWGGFLHLARTRWQSGILPRLQAVAASKCGRWTLRGDNDNGAAQEHCRYDCCSHHHPSYDSSGRPTLRSAAAT